MKKFDEAANYYERSIEILEKCNVINGYKEENLKLNYYNLGLLFEEIANL